MRPIDDDFADYVRARQHRLLRAAYLVCGDAHRAEDLLQQALEKLALRWDTVKAGAPDAYVRRILYRDAVSSWRRTRREHLRAVPPEPAVGALTSDEGMGDRVGDRIDLDAALGRLTRKQRAVLVLRFFEDRSEAETADVLGVSVGTVKRQTPARQPPTEHQPDGDQRRLEGRSRRHSLRRCPATGHRVQPAPVSGGRA